MGLHAVLQTAQLQVKFLGRRFRKPVDHPFSVASRRHNAFGPQVSQVFGNGNLGQFQNILEMADAKRALSQ
jgi:hypothetical protein